MRAHIRMQLLDCAPQVKCKCKRACAQHRYAILTRERERERNVVIGFITSMLHRASVRASCALRPPRITYDGMIYTSIMRVQSSVRSGESVNRYPSQTSPVALRELLELICVQLDRRE